MNRLKKWLLLLFTLLLVAVGAAMPYTVSYMQDAQQAEADVRSFDSFSLTLQQQGSDLARLLQTMKNGAYYIHEAARTEGAALTEGLALAAAEDLLTDLVDYGLLSKETLGRFFNPTVYPQLIIPVEYPNMGTDTNASIAPPDDSYVEFYTLDEDAIATWRIFWEQPSNCLIWLDDASGKAVYMDIPSLSGLGVPDGSAEFGERIYLLAEKWRAFLSDYYSTEVQITDETWYDNTVVFILSFPLGADEDQEVFTLALSFYYEEHFTLLSPY